MEAYSILLLFHVFTLIRKSRNRIRQYRKKIQSARQRRIRNCVRTRHALFAQHAIFKEQTARVARRIWSRPRSRSWWTDIVPGLSDYEWKENFRLNKATFKFLTDKLREKLQKTDTTFRKALPFDLKIAATLWTLATNVDYRIIGNLFGIARSTACMVFHDMVDGVNEVLTPKFIRCPITDMFRDIMDGFHDKWGFSHTLGL